MTHITRLPAEVVGLIADNLTDARDLCAFRQTCTDINAKTLSHFADRVIAKDRAVLMSKTGIESLIDMSNKPWFNSRKTSLTLVLPLPDPMVLAFRPETEDKFIREVMIGTSSGKSEEELVKVFRYLRGLQSMTLIGAVWRYVPPDQTSRYREWTACTDFLASWVSLERGKTISGAVGAKELSTKTDCFPGFEDSRVFDERDLRLRVLRTHLRMIVAALKRTRPDLRKFEFSSNIPFDPQSLLFNTLLAWIHGVPGVDELSIGFRNTSLGPGYPMPSRPLDVPPWSIWKFSDLKKLHLEGITSETSFFRKMLRHYTAMESITLTDMKVNHWSLARFFRSNQATLKNIGLEKVEVMMPDGIIAGSPAGWTIWAMFYPVSHPRMNGGDTEILLTFKSGRPKIKVWRERLEEVLVRLENLAQ